MRAAVRLLLLAKSRYVGPLDLVSGAAAAYSVGRKLRAAYTGPLFELRKTIGVDSFEQDFYPLANGYLDTAAVAAYLAGADSHGISAIYDQVGSRNRTQSTAALQAQFIASGQNGRPIARFDGSRIYDFTSLALANFTLFMAYQANVPTLSVHYLLAGSGQGFYTGGTTGTATGYGESDGVSAREADVEPTTFGIVTAQNAKLWRNGTEPGYSDTGTLAGLTLTRLGGRPDVGTLNFIGDYAEDFDFNSTLSDTDRQLLERNQGAFYSVTVA